MRVNQTMVDRGLPFMSIEEASEYTALSVDIIKSLIRIGKIGKLPGNNLLDKRFACLPRKQVTPWISETENGIPIILTADDSAELLGLSVDDIICEVEKNRIPFLNLRLRKGIAESVRFIKERIIRWYVYEYDPNSISGIAHPPSQSFPTKKDGERRRAKGSWSLETIESAFSSSDISEATYPQSFVYFIECGVYTKIGVSGSPYGRMNELSTGNPFPMKIVALIPTKATSSYVVEAALHELFYEYRWSGEWFELESVISDELYQKYSPDKWELAGNGRLKRKEGM